MADPKPVATYKDRPASELTHAELLAAYTQLFDLQLALNENRRKIAALTAKYWPCEPFGGGR